MEEKFEINPPSLEKLEEIPLENQSDLTKESLLMVNDFDDILDIVGGYGWYQKRMLFFVLAPLCLLCPFLDPWIFLLSQPDHWCRVPGKPIEMDVQAWKNLTLPVEIGADGRPAFSKCEILDVNNTKRKCDVWDYDQSNYESTIPADYNWVCGKSHFTANAFLATRIGYTAGTVLLGIAVDKFGRKPTYFVSVFCFVISSATSLFMPGNYAGFLIIQAVSGFFNCLLIISPAVITMELVHKDTRAWTYTATTVAFTIGNSLLPLTAYLLRSWFPLGLITPTLALLIFGYYKILPESPRWLIALGRQKEATKIIQDMARLNGKKLEPAKLSQMMKQLFAKKEEQIKANTAAQFWSLFSRPKVALRTILLGLIAAVNYIIFGGINLNITNLAGNEFLNYFLLTIVRLPGGWLAGFIATKFGRRWTKTAFFFLVALAFMCAAVGSHLSNSTTIIMAASVCGMFMLSINALIVDLHATELFPTTLRSTGSSFAILIASVLDFSTPYIALMGKTYKSAPFMVFAMAALVGSLISPLLPETANRKLPDSLEDANQFGKGHKFWSWLSKDKSSAN